MSWIKIDDQFADHPKVLQAGPLASWLYVCGLTYAGRYLTDGWIPAAQVRKLADVDDAMALAARLVSVGLWEPVEGGYLIHDYHDYNPTADKVRADRAAAAKRQADWRDGHRDKAGQYQASDAPRNAASNAVTNGEVTTAPSPSPVPVPAPNPVLERSDATHRGADAPPPRAFEGWIGLLREEKNRNAVLVHMHEVLYPGREPPEYGYVGKTARAVGGAANLARLLWEHSVRPPVGDVLAYVREVHCGVKARSNRARDEPLEPAGYAGIRTFLESEGTHNGDP